MGQSTHYPIILASLIKNAQIKTVLELGLGAGESAEAMLKALPKNGHMWSMDIAKCKAVSIKLASEYNGKWDFLAEVDDINARWKETVDMVYIDTSHTYEQTLKELEKFAPYASRFIVLHDTASNPPVREAIVEFLTDDKKWAWAEWSHEFGLAMLMRI